MNLVKGLHQQYVQQQQQQQAISAPSTMMLQTSPTTFTFPGQGGLLQLLNSNVQLPQQRLQQVNTIGGTASIPQAQIQQPQQPGNTFNFTMNAVPTNLANLVHQQQGNSNQQGKKKDQ